MDVTFLASEFHFLVPELPVQFWSGSSHCWDAHVKYLSGALTKTADDDCWLKVLIWQTTKAWVWCFSLAAFTPFDPGCGRLENSFGVFLLFQLKDKKKKTYNLYIWTAHDHIPLQLPVWCPVSRKMQHLATFCIRLDKFYSRSVWEPKHTRKENRAVLRRSKLFVNGGFLFRKCEEAPEPGLFLLVIYEPVLRRTRGFLSGLLAASLLLKCSMIHRPDPSSSRNDNNDFNVQNTRSGVSHYYLVPGFLTCFHYSMRSLAWLNRIWQEWNYSPPPPPSELQSLRQRQPILRFNKCWEHHRGVQHFPLSSSELLKGDAAYHSQNCSICSTTVWWQAEVLTVLPPPSVLCHWCVIF